ncbi:hypothetical protein ACFYSC_18100 [Streptosporangium sp. NPDC004379]|uniref:hypothetical protein n=1 Tax=Streptosporangium sp. NPDC004379 TaxID=3366189 RepID=UPI0036CCE3FA
MTRGEPTAECRHCGCELERIPGRNGPVHLRRIRRGDVDRVPCEGDGSPDRKHELETSSVNDTG